MPAAKGISSLPPEAQAGISAALGRDLPTYHAVAAISDRRSDSAAISSSPAGGPLQGRLRPPLQEAIFTTRNARNKLAADFTAQGVTVRSGTARWKMALAGYGYSNDLKSVTATAPTANANRVEYRRGNLTEWYVNGPMGLEQGFTFSARPRAAKNMDSEGVKGGFDRKGGVDGKGGVRASNEGVDGKGGVLTPPGAILLPLNPDTLSPAWGKGVRRMSEGALYGGTEVPPFRGARTFRSARQESEPLTIALALSDDLRAKMDPNGKGLTLSGSSPVASPSASPRPSLRYAGLTATDASGKELPASLELRGQELLLNVNDAGARYPV